MEQLTETIKILAKLLLRSGVSKNNSIAVCALLKEDERAMKDLFLWIYDNHPTEEQIMRKTIAMSNRNKG